MKPRVIWLDDDIFSSKLRGTLAKFEKVFDIIPCETIDDFRNNSQRNEWDAAILDVLNRAAKPDDIMSSTSIAREEGKLWFVFSGQDTITKQDHWVKRVLNSPEYQRSYVSEIVYVKSEHEEKLIEDITNAVLNQKRWQVENQYEDVLKVADNLLEDKDCRKHLLDILCAASGVSDIDSHLYYNRIRVILEWMFRAANKVGLLHDKCFDNLGRINLTDSCQFLSGKPTLHAGVICKQAYFPVLLANNVRYILEVTGGASHTTVVDEKDLPNLTAYWSNIETPYLLYSLTFMLCDVLLWFNNYIKDHNDPSSNKSQWKALELCGIVEQDGNGNYYVGDCFIPNGRMKYCKPGSYVEVIEYEETDSKYKTPYPITAKRFKN